MEFVVNFTYLKRKVEWYGFFIVPWCTVAKTRDGYVKSVGLNNTRLED